MKNKTEQNITSELLKHLTLILSWIIISLTLSRPGFFCLLGPGEGADSPPLHNFASIKSMTMRLEGEYKTYKYVSFEVHNEK